MGFETENRYSVATPDGDKLLYAAEECSFLGRNFSKSHRPLTLKAADAQGRVAFEASRNFFAPSPVRRAGAKVHPGGFHRA